MNIVPCTIFDRPAFILCTDVNDEGTGRHPRTIAEIAADIDFRKLCDLHDGDVVSISIDD